MLGVPPTLIAAALGDELTESEASLRVFLTAGGLAILGLMLTLFTIWWWRGTRPEPPALGPLEVMGDRRWNTATDAERRRMIDLHRPENSFELEGVVAPIPIDLSVLARDLPRGFDDLREPVLALGPSPDDVLSPDEPQPEHADAAPIDHGSAHHGPADGVSADGVSVEHDPLIVAELQLNGVQVKPVDVEPGADADADADATMYQVESPLLERAARSGADVDGHDDVAVETELDHFDVLNHHESNEPSGELVIDPLLQRTASQD